MARTILLTSLTRLFTPIPECDRIFTCPKNGMFPFQERKSHIKRLIPLSELMFIVYPISPKTYDEIRHGEHVDIFVFQRCLIDKDQLEIMGFIKTLRDFARNDETLCIRTCNSPVYIVDNDPRIEYETPPDSPLRHLLNLPSEIYEKSKLPPEIDEIISGKIIQLPDRNSKNVFYFGHIIGLYIFVEINNATGEFIVRHYTGTDNTRHDSLHTYLKVENASVHSYVEFGPDESMLLNRRMILGFVNFNEFLKEVFDFDHVANIRIIQSSDIGNTQANLEKRAASKWLDEDDDDPGYLGTHDDQFMKAMMDQFKDNYGIPDIF